MARAPSRALVVVGMGVVLLAGACGGSSSTSTSTDPIAHGSARSGVGPAAREVCEDMVRDSLPYSVGLPPVGEPAQTVQGDTFSCLHMFDGGSLDLSVRDLHTVRQAREYFRRLRGRESVGDALSGLAEGGFTKADGSVVAMKDAMVLTVDVTRLPPTENDPANVGIDVASTVLGCW